MSDTQRKSLREDIAEVLNDDNGYSHAVQTWAAIARDLLENLDAADARIKAVRELHQHGGAMFDERLEDHTHVCASCLEEYPCPTILALDGAATD